MELKRGQKVIYARGTPYLSVYDYMPHVAEVGKIGDGFLRLKHSKDDKIGEAHDTRYVENQILCFSGGDNAMKSALSAATEAYEEMMKTIKTAQNKYLETLKTIRELNHDR